MVAEPGVELLLFGCWRVVVSIVVYSGVGVETRVLFGMAAEQMAQMFMQLQQLSQQLVNQQQMFQQSLEMQRRQSQAQMETLTNFGAAQVAKTTYDARDFQTKSFSKMKGFEGDEKAWPDWRYKFRVEASRSFRQAAAIFGFGLRTCMINRFPSRTSNGLLRRRTG